jgi:hypothetical protein
MIIWKNDIIQYNHKCRVNIWHWHGHVSNTDTPNSRKDYAIYNYNSYSSFFLVCFFFCRNSERESVQAFLLFFIFLFLFFTYIFLFFPFNLPLIIDFFSLFSQNYTLQLPPYWSNFFRITIFLGYIL